MTSSRQALDLAVRLLIDPGDEVWIKEPGYPGAKATLLANGANMIPVPVDSEGLNVERGTRLAPRARLA